MDAAPDGQAYIPTNDFRWEYDVGGGKKRYKHPDIPHVHGYILVQKFITRPIRLEGEKQYTKWVPIPAIKE